MKHVLQGSEHKGELCKMEGWQGERTFHTPIPECVFVCVCSVIQTVC